MTYSEQLGDVVERVGLEDHLRVGDGAVAVRALDVVADLVGNCDERKVGRWEDGSRNEHESIEVKRGGEKGKAGKDKPVGSVDE